MKDDGQRFGREFAYRNEEGELKTTRAVFYKAGYESKESVVRDAERVFDFFLEELIFKSRPGCFLFTPDIGVI